MVSKNTLKQLVQLGQKKFRNQYGLFSVEGKKAIATFLENGYELVHYFGLEKDAEYYSDVEIISHAEMKKLSNLNTPSLFWAAFVLPKSIPFVSQPVNLALDGVRDPGNLGTIIRLCDWFGIQHLVCSTDTVDCFNPKVVQASMGSLANVHVHYTDLPSFLAQHELTAIGTDTNGEHMHDLKLPTNAILIMGNEGKGISSALSSLVKQRIAIPSYGKPAAESLNVAMATGILLSEFRKRV